MSYQVVKRYEGTLNAYSSMKEANLKKLNNVWFQIYEILGKVIVSR